MTALFDTTDQYVSRTAGASLRGLDRPPGGAADAGAAPEPMAAAEQVTVLSAHAALGHEWDLVVIAGLQEGLWPNTIPRGGVLGTQRLLDVLDGVTENAVDAGDRCWPRSGGCWWPRWAGRASRLLVTAVDGEASDGGEAALPSPFFYEIAQWDHAGSVRCGARTR